MTNLAATITTHPQKDAMPNQRPGQELFIPVHGYVRLFKEEISVIDHPAFQRLRRMRQLGFAHLVFPGGIHTRFEHSIGSLHVAQTIIDHINENFEIGKDRNRGGWVLTRIEERTRRFIRLAALLHDIGHIPFGHTLEDELNHLASHEGLAGCSKTPPLQRRWDNSGIA